VAVLGLVALVLVVLAQRTGEPVAWARFDTQDVHSLAFVDDDPQRLLFGHHGGLLATTDGGRSWTPMSVRSDAMSTSPAGDGSVVIAGHEVFLASRDNGSTWAPISTDLPSLDIHGFSRDPGDPNRMWAYLAIGGLWESMDFGAHWVRVREDNVLFPVAVRVGSAVRLLGVDTSGLVASDDGGRTWAVIGAPETYPMTALAATPDGRTVYAGSTDRLLRSDDGGGSWTRTGYTGSVFAVATTPDGATVAVVSQETQFFRSGDRGASWPGP
jgi:photosystem II stability/assembly factor-like uncharacterized protein